MGLTGRPTKNIDLSKIDDIQDEFFGKELKQKTENIQTGNSTKKLEQHSTVKSKILDALEISENKKAVETEIALEEKPKNFKYNLDDIEERELGNQKIVELLATPKIEGVRHTSRPFTVPRSLTIDLNLLKAKFRARDLQYTQNELMDKMIKESLEKVTADNYISLREKAFKFVKTPEQCSRRSVTLTEEAVSGMAELKANLAQSKNRRFSSDEIFTTLLAIAFSSLYENSLL